MNIENTLKNIYLDVIAQNLNTTHPFLSAIEHTYRDVWGKYIRKHMRVGNDYVDLELELANIYGTIELSEKAMRACANNNTAWVDLLNSEIEDMMRQVKNDMSKQLFYDGGISGFNEIFQRDGNIYGLDRTDCPQFIPYIQEDFGELTENKLFDVIDRLEEIPDCIITSSNILKSLPLNNDINCYDRSILSLGGIPVTCDKNCPDDTMYILNSHNFALHKLCDWQWLEGDDGKILKKSANKPVYTATLVNYANLMCDNPSNQAMLTGIAIKR